jgi:hypothetical protein
MMKSVLKLLNIGTSLQHPVLRTGGRGREREGGGERERGNMEQHSKTKAWTWAPSIVFSKEWESVSGGERKFIYELMFN